MRTLILVVYNRVFFKSEMAQKFTALVKNIRLLCNFMVKSFNNVQTSILCHYSLAAALILIQKGDVGKHPCKSKFQRLGCGNMTPTTKKWHS